MRKYTVVVEWADSGAGVEDADEVVVYGESPREAIDKARKKWRLTNGADWPRCRITRAFVLTPEKIAEFL